MAAERDQEGAGSGSAAMENGKRDIESAVLANTDDRENSDAESAVLARVEDEDDRDNKSEASGDNRSEDNDFEISISVNGDDGEDSEWDPEASDDEDGNYEILAFDDENAFVDVRAPLPSHFSAQSAREAEGQTDMLACLQEHGLTQLATGTIEDLPVEVKLRVTSFLDIRSLLNLKRCNKWYNKLLTGENLKTVLKETMFPHQRSMLRYAVHARRVSLSTEVLYPWRELLHLNYNRGLQRRRNMEWETRYNTTEHNVVQLVKEIDGIVWREAAVAGQGGANGAVGLRLLMNHARLIGKMIEGVKGDLYKGQWMAYAP